MSEAPYQQRVNQWLIACFGSEIAADQTERNHRFIEEALELVQPCGMTASECRQLVDYVFGRPVGNVQQEVGGVMNTLAALCLAQGVNMKDAAEVELARCWVKIDRIREKQKAKPKHSVLPIPGTDGYRWYCGHGAQPESYDLVGDDREEAIAYALDTALLTATLRHWHFMARRYCDGRMSTAAGSFNDDVRKATALGINFPEPLFARDGMGRAYDGLTDSEAAAAEADMPRGHAVLEAEWVARTQDLHDRIATALRHLAPLGDIQVGTSSKAELEHAVREALLAAQALDPVPGSERNG